MCNPFRKEATATTVFETHERMLHKSDKGVMGWKNNEQSYKIIVHKHTHTLTTLCTSERQKKRVVENSSTTTINARLNV